MDFPLLLEAADKLGVIVGMVIIAYGLWKKQLVPGWVYEQCEKERAELKALLETHATRTEARVQMLEQERDKKYVPS